MKSTPGAIQLDTPTTTRSGMSTVIHFFALTLEVALSGAGSEEELHLSIPFEVGEAIIAEGCLEVKR